MLYTIVFLIIVIVIAAIILISKSKVQYNDSFEADIYRSRYRLKNTIEYIYNLYNTTNKSERNTIMILHRLRHMNKIGFINDNFEFLCSIYQREKIPITSDPIKVILKLDEIFNIAEPFFYKERYGYLKHRLLKAIENDSRKAEILEEIKEADQYETFKSRVSELFSICCRYGFHKIR